MRRFVLLFAATVLCSLAMASLAPAKPSAGSGYTLVGDATLISPGYNSNTAVQMATSGTAYGGIGFAVAPGMKLADVNTLSTYYELLFGSCGGGSPRFSIGLAKGSSTPKEIWFYFGRQSDGSIQCPLAGSGYAYTGNLASPNFLVDTTALPGGKLYDPYSDVQARYGSYLIKYIAIDVDGGGGQTVNVDDTQVNSVVYTYEQP